MKCVFERSLHDLFLNSGGPAARALPMITRQSTDENGPKARERIRSSGCGEMQIDPYCTRAAVLPCFELSSRQRVLKVDVELKPNVVEVGGRVYLAAVCLTQWHNAWIRRFELGKLAVCVNLCPLCGHVRLICRAPM